MFHRSTVEDIGVTVPLLDSTQKNDVQGPTVDLPDYESQ